jgi:hypothetical protein
MDTTYNGDNFAALDFGDESGYDSGAVPDFGDESGHDSGAALDFGDESGHDTGPQSAIDALHTDDSAEPAGTGTELRVTDTLPEDTGDTQHTDAEEEEFSWELTTVTNPPETVSVTALMGGRIQSVDLLPDALSMTESELADEILVIADLASQRASSVLRTLLIEGMQAQGVDDQALADFLGTRGLDLTPPKQAAQAQAEVFATRYAASPRQ